MRRMDAPSPAVQIADHSRSVYYLRPLATIEPTAIQAGMPMKMKYGYNDIASLEPALMTSSKIDSTISVAWEHAYLQKVVQNL